MEVPSYYSQPNSPPRIGEWFSESTTLFSREWKTWTLQGLVYLVLSVLPILPGLAMYYVSLFAMMAKMSAATGTPGAPPPFPTEMFAGLGFLTAGGCLSAVVGMYLLAGMTRTAAKQLRGEPIDVKDIFTGADVLVPDLGAYFLGSLGLYLAFGLCIVPGFLLMGLWLYVHPLIVERRLSISEAFRQSGAVTRPHLGMYILWSVVMVLMLYAGSIVGIGMIVTLPITILMWMVSYRDAVGLPGALPAAVAQRPAPYGAGAEPRWAATATRTCPSCQRPVEPGAQNCPACGTPLPLG
jgi:hypothetical protein